MLFNSTQFVVFFAIVYALYLFARERVLQNIIILVASYVFYACAAPKYSYFLYFTRWRLSELLLALIARPRRFGAGPI